MRPEGYRHLLRSELLGRIKRNARYSVRAFARDLSVSSAFMSQVLNGNRSLSEANGLKVARALGWEIQKTDLFLHLIRLEQCKDPALRTLLYQEAHGTFDFIDLEAEAFEAISNWLHFAILELTLVKGFKSNSLWMARRLGVTKQEIDDAVGRLISLGLLAKEGSILAIVKNSSVPDTPSAAMRNFHKTHLLKAARALEEQNFDQYHFSGITTAIDPRNLPVAEAMIKTFRRKLMKVLEQGEKTAVYQISFQLYQLDRETRH